MEKFINLCKKISYVPDFTASLDGLQVSTSSSSWQYVFKMQQVIDPKKTSSFVDHLKKYTLTNCKDVIRVNVKIDYFDKFIPAYLVEKYYVFSKEHLVKELARINMLNNYNISFFDNRIDIYSPADDIELLDTLIPFLNSFLDKLGVEIKVNIIESEGISAKDLIANEQENILKTNIINTRKYKSTGKVDGENFSITKLPFDSEELNRFGNGKIVLTGKIVSTEFVEFERKTSLISGVITDFGDSINFKKFFTPNDPTRDLFLDIIKENAFVKMSGVLEFDNYKKDIVLSLYSIEEIPSDKEDEEILENERVELHIHSKMTTMDGITSIEDYVKEANRRKMPALALTDLNSVQAFPDFDHAIHDTNIKPIYGLEISSLNDKDIIITRNEFDSNLDDLTYTVFDIETTGLSVYANDIIELAAIKVKNGVFIDKYSEFVKIDYFLSEFTKNLTQIKDSDLVGAKSERLVMKEFLEFSRGTVLVAHNASFDVDFIIEKLKKYELFENDFTSIDTLNLARVLYYDDPKITYYNLKALSKFLNVEQSNHHRAIFDTEATAFILNKLLQEVNKRGYHNLKDLNSIIIEENKHKYGFTKHVTLLSRNLVGKKNMYKLLSLGNTVKFVDETRVLFSDIEDYREGLLVGSSCMNGEIFEFALNKSYSDLLKRVEFYDYIEIQPPSVYSVLLETSNGDVTTDRIKEVIKKIISAAKEKGKIIVATSDAHHLNKEDKEFRKIYFKSLQVGGKRHKLASIENIVSSHFFTTKEMLDEFSFLNDEKLINEIVIENTHKINELIEEYPLFPKDLFKIPDDFLKDFGYPSSDVEVRKMVYENAKNQYSDNLPEIIKTRLDKELNTILSHGFGNLYFISHLLVKNSVDAGYLVGSRGSVGSSLVATMMKITEVNPLPPHYYCPNCKISVFKGEHLEDQTLSELQSIVNNSDSGYDLEDKICPKCGSQLGKDGNDTPFEVFLGFEGDKVPDIDLNFSSEYQDKAHEELRKWFGVDYAFRAGTVSAIKDKKAYGFVKGYYKDKNLRVRNAEVSRIVKEIVGVKQSTGQHPGGIVIVPNNVEIYDVTPIQYPANDVKSPWRTTHFDYHSFEANLFKVDVLGHDDPTMIAYLMKFVNENPSEFNFTSVYDIPIVDKDVMKLFSSTESLGVTSDQILSNVGTYAIPEMGTQFVRQMLEDTKPKTFSDLVKISGLSHGTDVWLNNAKSLVDGSTSFGKIPFSEVIGCRDDIMVYLMYQGVSPSDSFSIMETVRKGKKLSNEQIDIMKQNNVPEWYIWSCGQIKYMFPKAHAIAYVTMALRIAWFKVHAPIYFYSVYFSKRADKHDISSYILGYQGILEKVKEMNRKLSARQLSDVESKVIPVLLVALEMTARGFTFLGISLTHSDATNFVVSKDKKGLYIPFNAIDGLGDNIANKIIEARNHEPFKSIKDFKDRTGSSTSLMTKLIALNVFDGYDDEDGPNQMTLSLFD